MSIVNGLHQPLGNDPVFRDAARKHSVDLFDIRQPQSFNKLHFWSGEIFKVKTPKIAVLGMDCAIGKRTTCQFILEKLELPVVRPLQEGVEALLPVIRLFMQKKI